MAEETLRADLTPQLADGLETHAIRKPPPTRADQLSSVLAIPAPETAADPGSWIQARAVYTDPRGLQSADPYRWIYQTDEYGLLTALGAPATASSREVRQELGLPEDEPDFWHWLRNEHGLVTHAVEPAGGGGNRAASNLAPFPKLLTRRNYTVDGFFDLQSIDYPDGSSESWTYGNPFHLPSTHTDQLQRPTVYDRDARGNIEFVTEKDAAQQILRRTRTQYTAAPSTAAGLPGGLVTHVTQAFGTGDATTTFTEYYTSGRHAGLPWKVHSAYGSDVQTTVTFAYDAYRNPWTITDAAEHATIYTYDALDQLRKRQDPDPGTGQHGPPETFYDYDRLGNVISERNPRGYTTEFRYDGGGRLSKVLPPVPDGAAETEAAAAVEYRYDASGNLQQEIVHLDGDHAGIGVADRVIVREYDERNLLKTETWPAPFPAAVPAAAPLEEHPEIELGPVFEYRYDMLGQVRSQTLFRGNLNTLGGALLGLIITGFEYDRLGRLLKTHYPATDPFQLGLGHAASRVENIYDAAGRLQEVKTPRGTGSSITYVSTNYEYDDLDRLHKEILPADANGIRLTTQFAYDLRDNPLGKRVSAGAAALVTTNYYDRLDRLIAVDHPDESASQAGLLTLYAYRADGVLLRELTKAGSITPQNVHSLLQGTLGGYFTTAVQLDSLNAALVDNQGQAASEKVRFTRFAADRLGRVIEAVSPDPDGKGPAEPVIAAFVYDANGNVWEVRQSFTDQGTPKVLRTNTAYDALDRPWQVLGPLDAHGQRPETVYVYSADGQVRKSRQKNIAGGVITWHETQVFFDRLGRAYATLAPDPGTGVPRPVQYAFRDPAGNVVAQAADFLTAGEAVDTHQVPAAKQVLSVYDSLNRPTVITSTLAEGYQTTAGGGAQGPYYDRPLRTEVNYNADGSVQQRAEKYLDSLDGVATRTRTTYTHDALGRTLSVQQTNPDRTVGYGYDGLGYLAAQTDANQNVTRYDNNWYGQPQWEWITLDGVDVPRGRLYDPWGNLIETLDRNGRAIRHDYDALGRRISEQWLGDPRNYRAGFSYNPLGQLISATDYNADGSMHSSVAWQYDLHQRPARITQAADVWQDTATLTYTDYDLLGNLRARTLSIGEADWAINTYRYDGLQRVSSIGQTAAGGSEPAVTAKHVAYTFGGPDYAFTRYEADQADPAQLIARTEVQHYADGRLKDITHSDRQGTTLGFTRLDYNLQGQIRHLAHTDEPAIALEHDGQGQLRSWSRQLADAAATTHYSYDANGNQDGDVGPYNRVRRDDYNTFEYDREGNVVRHWRYNADAVFAAAANGDEWIDAGQATLPRGW